MNSTPYKRDDWSQARILSKLEFLVRSKGIYIYIYTHTHKSYLCENNYLKVSIYNFLRVLFVFKHNFIMKMNSTPYEKRWLITYNKYIRIRILVYIYIYILRALFVFRHILLWRSIHSIWKVMIDHRQEPRSFLDLESKGIHKIWREGLKISASIKWITYQFYERVMVFPSMPAFRRIFHL